MACPLSVNGGQSAFMGASSDHKWPRFVECEQRVVIVGVQAGEGLMEILNETFGKLFNKDMRRHG